MHIILAKPSLERLPAIFLFFVFAVSANFSFAQTLPEIQRLMKQGQLPQALKAADALISSKPKDVQARFAKGLILTDMAKSAEAITVFTKMTEDFPELPEPYNNLAVLYAQQKQYDKARSALEMAIRTHPSYAIAHENLGDVYARLATQAYDKALQSNSSNASTQMKLALIKDLTSASSNSAAPIVLAKVDPSKPQANPVTPAKRADVLNAEKAATEKAKADQVAVAVAKADAEKVKDDQAAKAAKAAAAKTSPVPSAEKPPAIAGAEAEVIARLHAWASAWSNKELKFYLGFYANNFQTPKNIPRKQWEAERAQRINKPGKLQVTVSNIKVAITDDKATVRFRQQYNSSTLKTSANKLIVFTKAGGRWHIFQERVN